MGDLDLLDHDGVRDELGETLEHLEIETLDGDDGSFRIRKMEGFDELIELDDPEALGCCERSGHRVPGPPREMTKQPLSLLLGQGVRTGVVGLGLLALQGLLALRPGDGSLVPEQVALEHSADSFAVGLAGCAQVPHRGHPVMGGAVGVHGSSPSSAERWSGASRHPGAGTICHAPGSASPTPRPQGNTTRQRRAATAAEGEDGGPEVPSADGRASCRRPMRSSRRQPVGGLRPLAQRWPKGHPRTPQWGVRGKGAKRPHKGPERSGG